MFWSRRAFLQSLSRSALVIPLERILELALPSAEASQQNSLAATFVDVAGAAGLNYKTTYGGEHKNKYLLETTGCGVAFYDYDNDGWLDICLVNCSRLEGCPARQEPTSHPLKNKRSSTF